jgi:hypothetical protein
VNKESSNSVLVVFLKKYLHWQLFRTQIDSAGFCVRGTLSGQLSFEVIGEYTKSWKRKDRKIPRMGAHLKREQARVHISLQKVCCATVATGYQKQPSFIHMYYSDNEYA